jgi:hypothetical protein
MTLRVATPKRQGLQKKSGDSVGVTSCVAKRNQPIGPAQGRDEAKAHV